MLTQYFFRNNIDDNPPPLKEKSSWISSPCDNPTLINFFMRTKQDLISIDTPRRKTYSNLTLQEKPPLNNLKNNQSNVIKPCAKGGGICIRNTRDYLTKIHKHLQDHNTCKPLTCNPTIEIVNDSCTLIEYMHSQHIIDKTTMKFFIPLKSTHTPLFYGLPKFTSQTALSALLFMSVMVQVTISPILFSPQLTIFHHISKTKNIFSILLRNLHPSHPMPSWWSQLMSRPYTQTFHTKKA